jgi:hypothetical protein
MSSCSMNVPLFMSAFHVHEHRMNLQPSLVYSVLALSILLKSSDLEDGQTGRQKARTCSFILINRSRGKQTAVLTSQYRRDTVMLRTMAQMSLEQSIICNFITPGLAQAALVRNPTGPCVPRMFTSHLLFRFLSCSRCAATLSNQRAAHPPCCERSTV